jgi:hypothetical protein
MKNEGATTSQVEAETRKIPSILFLSLAGGAVALSAALMLSGKKGWANFVGQWVPSILILGTYNKITKTFTPPYDEEQRLRHGDNASFLKKQPSETRMGTSFTQP